MEAGLCQGLWPAWEWVCFYGLCTLGSKKIMRLPCQDSWSLWLARGLVAEKVRCRGSLTSRTGCSAKWLQNIDPWLGMLGSVGVIWNLPWSVTCRPVLAVLGACSWGTRCWWHASILENHCISGGLPAQAGTLPLRFLSFLMMPSCRNVKLS